MPKLRTEIRKNVLLIGTVLFFCLFNSLVFAANSPPNVGTVSPAFGSSRPNTTVSFTATYIDPDGYQTLKVALFLINSSLSGSNCFYGYYNCKEKKLYLYNDYGTTALGGYAPGSNKTIENSFVKLNCSKTKVSGSGTTLAVKWSVTFKSAFANNRIRNLYLYTYDNYGVNSGFLQRGTWLVGVNSVPQVISLEPQGGASQPDSPFELTAFYSDANGCQDIAQAKLIIHPSSASSSGGIYVSYNHNENTFSIWDQAKSKWLAASYGANTILKAKFGQLNVNASTITKLNNSLKVKFNLTAFSNFSSSKAKKVYLFASDDSSVNSGWGQKASFTIAPNFAPQINSITPLDYSAFLSGAKINIQINATDANNDPLEYQFSIAGTIKQAWSSNTTYAWQTSEADLGLSSVTCEVRDNKGGTASKTISLRVINPTVEEILQKVADNYAKIYDLKADMTLTSTLNAEPFGQTGYCRYFFKTPNKENTETFSDTTRATKTEAVITDSSNMHLIDHIKKTTQSIDLLTEVGISADQFSQMDLYYNQSNFLNNHTIIRNPETSDLNNFIVALEAVPKTENNIYTKLGLYIDYNKGLLSKIIYYKNEELPQILEAQETKQMPNGAWVVSVLKKTPNLKAGNLIITLTYTNLQINSGLSDSIFDPTKQY